MASFKWKCLSYFTGNHYIVNVTVVKSLTLGSSKALVDLTNLGSMKTFKTFAVNTI